MERYNLSKKDRRILYELSMNARQSLSSLGKKLRMSKQSLSYRLKLLERKGIIKGYYAIVDPNKIGFNHYRLWIKYQMPDEEQKQFNTHLHSRTFIPWWAYCDGSVDLILVLWSRNIREFEMAP